MKNIALQVKQLRMSKLLSYLVLFSIFAGLSIYLLSTRMSNNQPGSYLLSQYDGTEWTTRYSQSFTVDYQSKLFSFVPLNNELRIQIVQKDIPFASIEMVSLEACNQVLTPEYAIDVATGMSVLEDIIFDDLDVVSIHERPIELLWQIPPSCSSPVHVTLKANEYESFEENAFRYPKNVESLTYEFQNNGSFIVDGTIEEVDGVVEPTYSEFWESGTGHPANTTYIYVRDDAHAVYFAIDITLDNTDEFGQDWLKIFVLNSVDQMVKEYRVDDLFTQYGSCKFARTSKASYKHNTCEMRIPKADLEGNQLDFYLQYYGTAGEPEPTPTPTSTPVPNPELTISGFPETNGSVLATALSPDGNILYVGGEFSEITDSLGTYARNNVAAIDLTNLRVTTWDPNTNGSVHAIAVSGDSIFIGGAFRYVNGDSNTGVYRSEFAKLASSGLVSLECNPNIYFYEDTAFEDTAYEDVEPFTVYAIKIHSNYIYVGGHFNRIGGETEYSNLARLNNDETCSLDTWNPFVVGTVYAVDVSDEAVYAGGAIAAVGIDDDQVERKQFAKISTGDGSVFASCNPDLVTLSDLEFTFTVYSVLKSGQYLYLGGDFDLVYGSEGIERNKVVRLVDDATCSLNDWNPNVAAYEADEATVYSIATAYDDVIIGGIFQTVGEAQTSRSNIAWLNASTGLLSYWDPVITNGEVKTLIMTDNSIIVGGNFDTVDGINRNYLVAFPYEPPTNPVDVQTSSGTLVSGSSSRQSSAPFIQIPFMTSRERYNLVATPVGFSNTNGQEVVAVVPSDIFTFDGFLYAHYSNPSTFSTIESVRSNKITVGVDRKLLGIRISRQLFWQVGQVQEVWYKAYPVAGKDAPIIIPELQRQPSIIALKYKEADLVPPGYPASTFSEQSLKLAHSLDGNTWKILSNSVVDPIDNSVAAIAEVGGYYMIVGK